MSSSLSRIPPGVQYLFDEPVALRKWIEREVMGVFEGWSYAEIVLPIFDYAELFDLGMGKEEAERTYRFTGSDGKLLALRPEMTSLVARTIATRFRERARPIRLSYSGEVFRWDEPRGGHQYEFHHLGLEHIGSNRLEADTEVLVVAIEALRRIGLDGFKLTLSHMEFFNGLADALGLEEGDRRTYRDLVDRRQSEELREFYEGRGGSGWLRELGRLPDLTGGREVLTRARALTLNGRSVVALDDLDRVCETVEQIGLGSFLNLDLSDVGELDYYTGMTFKIYAPGLGRPLGRGGRYDQLLAKFGSPEAAVGFSVCLDWLAHLLAPKLSPLLPGTNQAEMVDAEDGLVEAFRRATQHRGEGRKVRITHGA